MRRRDCDIVAVDVAIIEEKEEEDGEFSMKEG